MQNFPQNFHCHFNSRDPYKRFSIENRLIWDASDGIETPGLSEAEGHMSERDRLDQINSDLDSFDNLTELPGNEDEMILHHLMSTVTKAEGNLDTFYTKESKESLGFFINDSGQYEIEGVDPIDPTGDNLAQYLTTNLRGNAATAGFNEVGDEDISATRLATQVATETGIAQEHYTFISENYDSITDLQEDVDKVQTLRQFAEVKRDYESGRETLLARSKVKEGMLSFEVRVDLVRRSAANATEAALLWYAINHFPELAFDETRLEDGKLNAYNIFNEDEIEQNGVAIVNGRLVVPYKPKGRELEDGLAYEYATYGYSVSDLDPALSRMRDPNNEFSNEGAEIADILEDGIEIYEGTLEKTRETIANFEANEVFQTNFELLRTIASAPSDMLTDQIDESLLEETPFNKEEGPWFFGHVDGISYGRSLSENGFEKGEVYKFDEEEGWKKVDRMPAAKYDFPTVLKKGKEGYEVNEEAATMAFALGLDPRRVMTHSLNELHKATRRNKAERKEVIAAFAEAPLGLQIPFPKLVDVEVAFDKEKRADSITNIQLLLFKDYSEFYPGLNHTTVQWLAKEMGEETYKALEEVVAYQNQGQLDPQRVYKISTKQPVDNFNNAILPSNIEKIDSEREFSEETKARVEQIHAYLEGLLENTVGKVAAILESKGMIGEILGGLFKEFIQMPLGNTWELSEDIAIEWERLEEESGQTLTFKEVVPKYAVEAIKLMKNPDTAKRIPAKSLLGKILGLMGYQNVQGVMVAPATMQAAQAQTATQQRPGQRPAQQPKSAFDLTQKEDAQLFQGRLKGLKGRFGATKSQRLLTDEDVADILEATAGDKEFTSDEFKKAVLKQLKKRIDKTEDAAEKAALKAEYDFLKSGKKPKEEEEKDREREERQRKREEERGKEETEEPEAPQAKPLVNLTTDKLEKGKYEIKNDSGYIDINNGRFVFTSLVIPSTAKIELIFEDGSNRTIKHPDAARTLINKNLGSDMKRPSELSIGKKILLPIEGDFDNAEQSDSILKSIRLYNKVQVRNPELHAY